MMGVDELSLVLLAGAAKEMLRWNTENWERSPWTGETEMEKEGVRTRGRMWKCNWVKAKMKEVRGGKKVMKQ